MPTRPLRSGQTPTPALPRSRQCGDTCSASSNLSISNPPWHQGQPIECIRVVPESSGRAEVVEDRKHTPVIASRRLQTELRVDGADMSLESLGADLQRRSDRVVGSALRHELEN